MKVLIGTVALFALGCLLLSRLITKCDAHTEDYRHDEMGGRPR